MVRQKRKHRLPKIDTMLIRMIGNSKGQFIAVLTIITLGVTIFTSLNMTTVNMDNTVDAYYKQNNFANLFIQTVAVPEQKVAQLEEINDVDRAMGRITIDVPMITDNQNERVNLRLITTTGEREELSSSTILEGKPISDFTREALLIEQFAKARGIEIGDEIQIQIHGKQYSLEVAGIVANPEYIYIMENNQSLLPAEENFGICYVMEDFGQQAAGLTGSYNEVLISYEDNADEELLIDSVEKALDLYGVKQVIKRENQLSHAIINQELIQLNNMASSIPILFLLVAALILAMMLSRMVKKDKIKIGVLKSIGYKNSQVLFHYVKYSLSAGVIGGAAGAILGMALAGGITRLFLEYFHIPMLRVEFYYSYLITAIILSTAFCIISGLIGARGALKITPADAMRSEAPRSGKRILMEKIPFLWKRLSFTSKMINKNIFRNKKRTLFVMAGISLTYAMMLFSTSMPSVMDQMMNEHFREFQRMDYNIGFVNPVHHNTVKDMEHLVDFDYIEGKLEYPFELTNGNKKKAANIIGLSRDTRFYTFIDDKGNETNIPRQGMLITENLAGALDVEKGDLIQINNYIPNKEDLVVQIKGVIKQSLGMNAYMDIDTMGSQLIERNVINGVYMDSNDPDINDKLNKAANVSTVMSTSDMINVYEEYMTMVIISIGVMVVFSGVLGFSIVYNATIVSLSEREMEFSSLRVLGFSKREIFLMILRENNILMILGIVIGIPMGVLMSKYSSAAFSTDIYTLDMTPNLPSLIYAGIYTVVFVILAQLATYRKIQKLDFLQALKSRES